MFPPSEIYPSETANVLARINEVLQQFGDRVGIEEASFSFSDEDGELVFNFNGKTWVIKDNALTELVL